MKVKKSQGVGNKEFLSHWPEKQILVIIKLICNVLCSQLLGLDKVQTTAVNDLGLMLYFKVQNRIKSENKSKAVFYKLFLEKSIHR